MIEEIILNNWKSHDYSKFNFDRGTNVLVGIMGSGKSSILSALSFALYGTFPEHRSKSVKLSDLINDLDNSNEEASVTLKFTIGNDNYKIKRVISEKYGTKTAELSKNGEILTSKPNNITQMVEEILDMDYDLFTKAVYSKQNGIDYFLEIPKGKRMKQIDRLLKINRFEKARSNTTTLSNRMSNYIEDKNNVLKELENNEEFEEIDELKKDIENLTKVISKLNERKKELDKKHHETKDKLEKINEKLKDKRNIENDLNNLNGSKKTISSDIEDLESKIDINESEVKEKLEKTENLLDKLKKHKKEVKEKIDEIKHKIQHNEIKIKDIDSKNTKIKKIDSKCPICDSKINENKKNEIIANRSKKIKKYEEKTNELQNNLDREKNNLEDLKNKIKDNEDVLKDIKNKKEVIIRIKTKKNKLNKLKEKINIKKTKVKEITDKYDENKLKEKQEKLTKLLSEKKGLESKIENKIELRDIKEKQMKKIKKRKEKYEKIKEEIRKMKNTNEDLKKLKSALKTTQQELRKNFILSVNDTMSEIWNDFYPYDDFTDIRLTINDGDYELQLYKNGQWYTLEAIASGGERTAGCLTLRISFALVLAPNIKWLILDEPTHNLDTKSVKKLAEILKTKVSKIVDQIFIITHDHNLEKAANAYMYELTRNKELNESTHIEKINQV